MKYDAEKVKEQVKKIFQKRGLLILPNKNNLYTTLVFDFPNKVLIYFSCVISFFSTKNWTVISNE